LPYQTYQADLADFRKANCRCGSTLRKPSAGALGPRVPFNIPDTEREKPLLRIDRDVFIMRELLEGWLHGHVCGTEVLSRDQSSEPCLLQSPSIRPD